MAITTLNLNKSLGQWPRNYVDQQQYLNKLLLEFNNFYASVLSNINSDVTLSQIVEPTQNEWEAAWTSQTGLLPPIPPSATLLWYDTSNNTFGGMYGTVEGNATVYRREHIYPRGSTIYLNQNYLNSSISTSTSLYSNNANLPVLTFSLPCTCHLYIYSAMNVTLSAGTGSWGIDYLVNGVKMGTQVYGAAADYGIVNTATAGFLACPAVWPNLPAGNYTVQMMFGYVGSPGTPPTLALGAAGVNDGRYMIVRAIVP